MGVYSPIALEKELYQNFIIEGFKNHGVPCKLYQINAISKDLNYDISSVVYKAPVDIDVLPEEFPKKALKELGWIHEDEEILPLLVHFPVRDRDNNSIVLARYCRVVFPTIFNEFEERNFLITRIRANAVDVIFWTCKLVPERIEADLDSETEGIQPRKIDDSVITDSFIKR